jgi:hypothetical protein
MSEEKPRVDWERVVKWVVWGAVCLALITDGRSPWWIVLVSVLVW